MQFTKINIANIAYTEEQLNMWTNRYSKSIFAQVPFVLYDRAQQKWQIMFIGNQLYRLYEQ